MNRINRFLLDVLICALVLVGILGLYSAAAIYLTDPIQPTVPDGAYTDWSQE